MRHSVGLLIPLPSDYGAALLLLGPWLLAASGLSALVVWAMLRGRGCRQAPIMQVVPSIFVDSATRLLFAEAWLGAAEEGHVAAALLPGIVYVVVLPSLATWLSVVLFARRRPQSPSTLVPGLLSLLVLIALVVFSSPPSRAADQAADSTENLLLVTIDTWRYDHFSAHPDAVSDDLTPRIDALAERGLVFTEARAHAPLTVPSHAAMLSGLRPWELGLLSNSGRVPPGVRWLPELLALEGLATGAVVSGAVLRGRRGFARGFDRFHDDLAASAGLGSLVSARLLAQLGVRPGRTVFRAPADRAVRRSKAFVRRQQGAWFLWMHLYDPHRPYSGGSAATKTAEHEAVLAALPDPCLYSQSPPKALFPAALLAHPSQRIEGAACDDRGGLAANVLAYQDEVRIADAAVGEFLDWLQQRGELQDTAIIVTADHGESMTEHGEWMSHQFSPYEPVLRVPLIVVPPGGVEPKVSAALVAHRDLPRTAAELLGLGTALAGRSWLEQIHEQSGRARVSSLAQARPAERSNASFGPRARIAVRNRQQSLVMGPGARLECYDLQSDPAQIRDLRLDPSYQAASDLFEEAERLRSRLAGQTGDARESPDPELEALRGLGYRE